jgi:hypothetical protein
MLRRVLRPVNGPAAQSRRDEPRLPPHLRAVVPRRRALHPRLPGQDLRGRPWPASHRRGQAQRLRAGPGDPARDGHQAGAGARLPAAGDEQLAAKGHVSRFSHGMRITDAVALDCAQEAAGQLRFEIEAAFSQGLPNTPMANATVRVVSGNFLTARPVGIVDGVDFGTAAWCGVSMPRPSGAPSTSVRWCCSAPSASRPPARPST